MIGPLNPFWKVGFCWLVVLASLVVARGEAMLELFQMTWPQLTQKMPELAEAGYTSLWLPPPAKAGSPSSVGYDLFDPFDFGYTNQNGSFATRYGTQAQLVQMVQMAHRFGIRVYFDNIMNHRTAVVPGYNSFTPTNYYPGMWPQDFHLKTTTANGGLYANWNDISDWCNAQDILYNPLLGLVDIANEPGSVNGNFGSTLYSTLPKVSFIRHPNHPEYYLNTNGPSLGGPWYPFYLTNGAAVADDVNSYLIRAVMWTLYTTKCDGFRLDAVKQVPAAFFGANSADPQTDDPTFSGYTGGIQAMYDYVHGYGSNVTGNGYIETDGNRNSCFDTEAPRNDAMIFGEHVNAPPDFQDYLNDGMRLLNYPLFGQMNSVLSGGGGFNGMDGRDYNPPEECCSENGTTFCYPTYSPALSTMFAQNQDAGACCPAHREMQDAYYFMHEGLPMIYSDNYNWAGPITNSFPIVAQADYLGEFGNNQMPEVCYLHRQLARGGTRSRWSDQWIVAWERYDYRDVNNVNGAAYTNAQATTVLFAMNANFGFPGDMLLDDGIARTSDGYYSCFESNTPTEGCGLGVEFPPGTVLTQMASTSTGVNRACPQLLVHNATTSKSLAQSSANDPFPTNRLIYVNTAPPPGGGAVEMLIPSGGWVMYAIQWPQPSRANALTNAITFRQNGGHVPSVVAYRQDGTNGDPSFNPNYPFFMRGSVDPFGNVLRAPGEGSVSNLIYAINVPIVTNAPFDILIASDASSVNTLVKLDGGIDLNSQMGLGPTNGPDLRDNQPGYASDIYLGYEQAAFNFRNGPEKFAARNLLSNNIVSLGAETYYYTVGATSNTIVPGAGDGESITNETADWVVHDPTNIVTSLASSNPPTQRYPLYPGTTSVAVWVKVGYQFQINTCFLYYTTDGSNPEGAYGVGEGTTQVVQGGFVNHDSAQNNIDWWQAVIPPQSTNTTVRYKVALFNGGSVYTGQSIQPISYAEPSGSKLYGLTQEAITNFNPMTAKVWLHNDLNPANTVTGLQSGFHVVRAQSFLPRNNASAVFNTFIQSFYYDNGQQPTGVIYFPPSDGSSITSSTYQFVVEADSSVSGVTFNIQDSEPANDDTITGQQNGNGNDANGALIFVSAAQVTADPTLTQENTNYTQEFRFNYVNVPDSGTATVTVHMNKFSTAIYTNHFTALSREVNTLAPTNVLYFSNPPTNNMPLVANSNTVYLVQACFTPTLTTTNTGLFALYINGVLQPSSSYILRGVGAVGGCPGLRSFLYNWSGIQSGVNTLQINFTNGASVLTDSRTVIVPPTSFQVSASGLANEPPLIVWSSIPGLNYMVFMTTNLDQPFTPISGLIPATGPSTFYPDPSTSAPQKFYDVQVVP